ncbi:MAG: hypothetical protein IJR41_04705 [Atopobiaceae bacterium]|nr:hypothetical protein [Atopobiaceae bacterium]
MDKRKTQTQRVLALLENGETITSLEAARMGHPIMDLPKRISELRRAGYVISGKREKSAEGARYMRYELVRP